MAEPEIEPATACSHVHNPTDWAMELGYSQWKNYNLLIH